MNEITMYNQNNRKMKKKRLAALALILPVLAGCNDHKDDPTPTDRIPLSLNAGIHMESGTATPAGTRATGTTWHQGDAIGVYTLVSGTGNVYDNQANFKYTNATADGTTASFNPADGPNTAYYPTDGTEVDILAYYPHQDIAENKMFIVVDVCDQTSLPAIDLMTANVVEGKNQDDPEAGLEFEHRLTKLVISVQKDASVSDLDISDAAITLKNTSGTAVYDLFAQAFKSFGETVDIELKGETAIVIPTSAGSGVSFAVRVDNKTYNAPLPADVAFVGGEEATITITLTGNPQTPASVTAIIKPWTGGPTEGVTAIDIEIPQGSMDITEEIIKFDLWKTINATDKRTYTLSNNNWTASPQPFYTNEISTGDTFEGTATIGQPSAVTELSDELKAAGTATENGKLSLEFSHIHSQIEFRLELADGLTADLTDATIDMADYTGFNANTVYIVDAIDWSNKNLIVTLADGSKFSSTADFTTLAGQKTVLNIKLDSSELVPASITIAAVVGWGTPVEADAEVFIDISEATHSLGALAAGIFKLESGQVSAEYTYNGDGKTLNPNGDAMNWKDLSTGVTHNFTLTYTSDTKLPEADVVVFTATGVSWGSRIIFDAGQRSNCKFSLELTAGTGYEQTDMDGVEVVIEGFTTADYSYNYSNANTESNFAILKPQQTISANHIITITISSHSYSIDLSKHFSKFEAGKEYTLKGTVNKSGLPEVTIGTITDWTSGGDGTGDFEY